MDVAVSKLVERRAHYQAVAGAVAAPSADGARLQSSVLEALADAGLDDSVEALVGAALVVDHALRCLTVASAVSDLFGEGPSAAGEVATGCLANSALLLVDLLAQQDR